MNGMTVEELRGKAWRLQRYIAQGKPHKRHRPMGGGGIRLKNLMERDRNRCHLCGRGVRPEDASRDHIRPGGSSAASNLALAHRACNNARGNAPSDTRVIKRGWRKPSKRPAGRP